MNGRALRLTGQALALALVAGLLAVLGWRLANDDHTVAKGAAPHFQLPRLNGGGDLDLASLRGKAVVLNFWASWCVPCKQEAPALEKIWQEYRSKGVVVLGVDSEDYSGDARSFMRKYDITYPVVREGGNDLYAPYGVSGVPETRVIDRDGKYAGTQFYGATTAGDLRRSVETALRS